MIIPSLINYYNRLADDPDSNVAPYGWSRQQVSFAVVIDAQGMFKSIGDLRKQRQGGKRTYLYVEKHTLPGYATKTGTGINPGFLWGNPAYMLGLAVAKQASGKNVDTNRVCMQFEAFRDRHLALEHEVDDEHFTAVCKFLKNWDPAEHKDEAKQLAEYVPGFGVFQIRGQSEFVHDREEIKAYWNRSLESPPEEAEDDPPPRIPSLVTGEFEPLARTHKPQISGVLGQQTTGTALVSFNRTAFESYGKDQSFNAPVGVRDAVAYCTALNYLLEDKTRRVTIGEDTYVAWAERPVEFEGKLFEVRAADLMDNATPAPVTVTETAPETSPSPGAVPSSDEAGEAEDRQRAARLHEALQSIREGKGVPPSLGDANVPFYILGLSPNAARLHVRYWLKTTLGELAKNLAHHFAALELDGEPPGYRPPSIRDIVGETLPPDNGWPDHSRADKGLAAEILRAVLTGRRYPDRLLGGVIERVRSEGFADPDRRHSAFAVAHRRASIIRACLIEDRSKTKSLSEVPVSLNENHPSTAYHIGRLFAVLEKAQEEASESKLNKTIKDGYFASVSSAPAAVLPRLLTLHAHHLRKIENPKHRARLEGFVEKIQGRITDEYPAFLGLKERGFFFLGYYHQRTAFFVKTEKEEAATA